MDFLLAIAPIFLGPVGRSSGKRGLKAPLALPDSE